MIVVITGTSRGIGLAIARRFVALGHVVYGIDREPAAFVADGYYTHVVADVRHLETVTEIPVNPDIVISNAGTQNEDDIDINLKGAINFVEKYAIQPNIKSVLIIGSASAHTGDEFPNYVASKGGLLAYTRNVARRVAVFGATCNSLDPGGVITNLNRCILDDPALWDQVMAVTPLKRWATAEEIAEWVFFLTTINKSCTGQNILNDNGESLINNFVWK